MMTSVSIIAEAETFVRELLGKALDKRLCYHNLEHTLHVVKQATYLADTEGLSYEDAELVMLAEWFHDTGFTVTYIGHEQESARIASDFLRPLLPEEKVKKIAGCILATRRGTIPQDKLQRIMHDADYYHFFHPEYFRLLTNLRKEVHDYLGKSFTDERWAQLNSKFLLQHVFYTSVFKVRWPAQRKQLLIENDRMISAFSDR